MNKKAFSDLDMLEWIKITIKIFSTTFILVGLYYIVSPILGSKIIFTDKKWVVVIVGIVLVIIGLLLKKQKKLNLKIIEKS